MRELSKYYTPSDVAKYCVSKAKDIIGEENIDEYLEPSAGGGIFLDFLEKPFEAYDICPEDDRVTQMDFLSYGANKSFKKRRVCIGNPPFNCGNLLRKFFKITSSYCGYIAFILPLSYYKHELYDIKNAFLIHSESLGKVDFDGVLVDVCFNIYEIRDENRKPSELRDDVQLTPYSGTIIYPHGVCFKIWKVWDKNNCGNYTVDPYSIGFTKRPRHMIFSALDTSLYDSFIRFLTTTNFRKYVGNTMFGGLIDSVPRLKEILLAEGYTEFFNQ